jgi:hypothetical protein
MSMFLSTHQLLSHLVDFYEIQQGVHAAEGAVNTIRLTL